MTTTPRVLIPLLITTLVALTACRKDGERAGPATSGPTAGKAKAGLRLRLVAARATLAAKQPLKLRVFLDNTSKAPLVVFKRTSHVDLGLDAKDDDGEFITTLLPPGPPMPPAAKDLTTLAPGASLELTNWELLNRINQQIARGNGRTGTFHVHASYHAGVGTTEKLRELNKAAWVGSLESNEVLVTVK